jgi:hypothetical protein
MEPIAGTIVPRRTLREGIELRFRGVPMNQAGEDTGDELIDVALVVPPLNLGSLRKLKARLDSFGQAAGTEDMETLCEAVLQALTRNYSGVPRWLVEQTIDVANMPELMTAVMDVSGMRRKEIEAGKAKAADASIGTISIAT